jgi:hypothetical protein
LSTERSEQLTSISADVIVTALQGIADAVGEILVPFFLIPSHSSLSFLPHSTQVTSANTKEPNWEVLLMVQRMTLSKINPICAL